jgi:uncharacterized membrane protein
MRTLEPHRVPESLAADRPPENPPLPARPPRLDSIDLLRGIAMVLMALDHVRDFFTSVRFDPLDLTQTTPALFLTRWITHYCAPGFVFLAGTAAFLSLSRGRSPRQLSRFLVTRGVWLVILELTVVRFAWLFNLDYSLSFGQVIWAIGWSMVVLSALVHFPAIWSAVLGIAMIALHNLADTLQPAAFGSLSWLWKILHVQGEIALGGGAVFLTSYPLIPWIGVMAAGYAFGQVLRWEQARRRLAFLWIGGVASGLFLVLRVSNVYGDPSPWEVQSSSLYSLLSILNTTKYPPSLLYLLMTLGPAIVLLPLLERWRGWLAEALIVFGRVPLFYYVLHILVAHALAVLAAVLLGYDPGFMFANNPPWKWPGEYGFTLPVVYGVWIGVVVGLYPLCRWFAAVKRRSRSGWLSYL